jgi:hypothetical protein
MLKKTKDGASGGKLSPSSDILANYMKENQPD